MPRYTYRCQGCDASTMLIVPIAHRDGDYACPVCGGSLQRKIDAPGMVWAPTSSSGGHR